MRMFCPLNLFYYVYINFLLVFLEDIVQHATIQKQLINYFKFINIHSVFSRAAYVCKIISYLVR